MQKLDFNMFKMLASREPVEARFMYGNPFFMTNYARTIYSINQLPTHVESTAGFFRRLLIIPFKVTIDKNKQDKRLAEKIVKQEAPGVLNYILTAMKAFNKNESLAIPEELERIIEDLETETDNVKQWMDENGYKADNKTPKVKLPTLKDLYFEYKDYCESAGIPGILGRTTFLRRLEKYGIKSIKAGRGLENVRRLNLGKCAV